MVFPGFIDAHSHWYQPNRIGDYGPEQINQVLLSRGWTGTNDVNVEPHFAEQLFGWAEQSRIDVRINAYLSLNTPGTDQHRHGDWYDAYELAPGDMIGDRLRIAGVKVFVGSDWDRVLKWTQPELDEVIATHAAQGWQIAAKQISDDSLDMSLSAFEALGSDTADRRHRLEHALEMRADQIPRVRRAGLVPVVQLGGLEADQWLEDGFLDITGDDGTDAVWPFRDMLDAGLPLAGSIAVAPAEGVRSAFTISVMQMLHGALTGISEIGNPPWPGRESQLMSADEALRTITTMAAFSTFEEDQRGSLQVGMLADLVVMSDDLRSAQADPDLLFDTQVVATLVDGELMWCGFGHDEWCATLGQELPARLLEEATLQPLVEGDLGPTAEPDPAGVGDVRVTASSFSSDFPPHLAVDGRTDFGGWVAAAPPPGWIEIDLGEPTDITKIELWVDQDPATASHHRVFGGPDPEPTELLGELLGETTWGQILTIEGNWSVRHLRIETLESTPTYGWLEVAVNGS